MTFDTAVASYLASPPCRQANFSYAGIKQANVAHNVCVASLQLALYQNIFFEKSDIANVLINFLNCRCDRRTWSKKMEKDFSKCDIFITVNRKISYSLTDTLVVASTELMGSSECVDSIHL